ncbi:MAG: putative membrane protein [Cryomorphaceae bacterium]|jgi:uncharacterized membrane protein
MDKPINENKWYGVVFGICILAAAAIAIMPWLGTVGMANPTTADTTGLWMNFLGKHHFLILHMPIGATVLVFILEALGLLTKSKPSTTLALAFAAGTAIFAVVFGYFLYLTDSYTINEQLEDHKNDGVIFTVMIILTFLIKYSYDVKKFNWLKPSYLVILMATVVMMYRAGHQGGVLVHKDPMNAFPSKVLAEREAKKEQDKIVVTDPVIYTNIVHNILENKCISCHGEDKVKSGLRLDSMAHMLEGGDEEEALVAGDIDESYMITTIMLPMEDDMHMPPKKKPQITPEELKILKWWIEMGAPENTKLSEVADVPEEITLAIATLKTPAELEEQRKQIRLAEEQADKQFKEKRTKLQAALKSVNEVFPGSLRYSSQEDTDLVFNSVSYRKQFKGSDLQILEAVATDVVELDLSSTTITDADIVHLAKFTNLRSLKLNETKITDEALSTIGKLENLRSLNLYGTVVTDAGIMAISKLKYLEKTYLWNTKVTPAGAEILRKALLESMHQNKDEEKRQEPVVDLGLISASVK